MCSISTRSCSSCGRHHPSDRGSFVAHLFPSNVKNIHNYEMFAELFSLHLKLFYCCKSSRTFCISFRNNLESSKQLEMLQNFLIFVNILKSSKLLLNGEERNNLKIWITQNMEEHFIKVLRSIWKYSSQEMTDPHPRNNQPTKT